MIKVEYQAWKDRNLVHEYIEFDREKAVADGLSEAVAKYDYCLSQFLKLSKEKRKEGLIYGGADYDFCFWEED